MLSSSIDPTSAGITTLSHKASLAGLVIVILISLRPDTEARGVERASGSDPALETGQRARLVEKLRENMTLFRWSPLRLSSHYLHYCCCVYNDDEISPDIEITPGAQNIGYDRTCVFSQGIMPE